MALADDVARLAREVWRQAMVVGWQARIGFGLDDGHVQTMGRLAKAAGATPEQVESWMRGESQPTTGQALAVLDALPLPAVNAAAMNGSAPHG